MTLVEQFNNLNGTTVKRKHIESILAQAKAENEINIIYRLSKLLNQYPDSNYFTLTVDQYSNDALNAPRHIGNYKLALDDCGRLKKGWKFENGNVVQVEKPQEKKVKPIEVKKPVAKKLTPAKKQSQPKAAPKKIKEQTFEKKTFKPEEWIKADVRKSTSLIKKYLKEKYNIKASVRSDFYSGGSSLHVSYVMGPESNMVESELKRLQYGRFDGMTDMYNYNDKAFNGIVLDGYRLYEYKYVFVDQDLTENFKVRLATVLSQEINYKDVPIMDGTKESYYKYFDSPFLHYSSWSQLFHYLTSGNKNFVTQDDHAIQNIKAFRDPESTKYYFTYTFEGTAYNTLKPKIYPTKMIKEKAIVKNKIVFFDYGKNTVAVIGLLGEIEDELLELGGKHSHKIKHDGKEHSGYVFNKSKSDQVINVLIDYSKQDEVGSLNSALPASFEIENAPVKTIVIPKDNMKVVQSFNPIVAQPIVPVVETQTFPENKPEIPVDTTTARTPEVRTVTSERKAAAKPSNPYVKSMADCGSNGNANYFDFYGPLGEFLGDLEVKPQESIVVTIDAPQGAGKTRLLFQIINMVTSAGYNPLFLSLEEHPDSSLFTGKRDEYLSEENKNKVHTMGSLPETPSKLYEIIENYEIVFIDSFGKLYNGIDLDKDIRKRYNGKLFFVIYQRTQDGKMRGGSASQFDADATMKVEKDATDYKNSYAYFDKHRYQSIPLGELKYNIFSKELG
ncbi:LPD29 domain-containing protein [Flavobacterium sp. J27]|uniref:LPD29 domain-containing protein n=1 Tax=Flavobacterium sp. J27 TaxID=2060419 RepID=UPI0010321859|nr:LPD29 domain-containing protein [Flavobacterium sp. J27]